MSTDKMARVSYLSISATTYRFCLTDLVPTALAETQSTVSNTSLALSKWLFKIAQSDKHAGCTT